MKEVANNFAETTGMNRDFSRQTRICGHPIINLVLFVLFSFDNNFLYDFIEYIARIFWKDKISMIKIEENSN